MSKLKWVLLILALMLTALTTGCVNRINQVMDSWVGHHKSELIRSWGPPTEVASDGAGGEILIYKFHRDLGQTEGKIRTDSGGTTRYTAPEKRGYYATRMFYVNKQGYIYHWRWQGY